MKALENKAIVITGAGRGIGAATARHLSRLGARVVVNDIDAGPAEETHAAITDAGGEAILHVGDIADWEIAGTLIESCLDGFGAIDGLVNNAGIWSMLALAEIERDSAARIFETNVQGTINCTAHAARPMMAQGRGSIVNITSGAHMGIPRAGLYGATKGAVASLTYAWAIELADTGVRINAISPMANTRMSQISDRYLRERGLPSNAPLNVPPEANTGPIAYLLSDAANGVNGQLVRIEGEQLSIYAHPAVLLPARRKEGGWDFDAVKDAFDGDFLNRLPPVGITGVEITGYGPPSQFWQEQAETTG